MSLEMLCNVLDVAVVFAATRWRDNVCTQHIEYDQRPDVFRYIKLKCCSRQGFIASLPPQISISNIFAVAAEAQFGMLVYMHTLGVQLAGEMIWSLLLTRSCSC